VNKKIIIVFVLISIIVILGLGTTTTTTTTTTKEKLFTEKITIGVTHWPGYFGLHIADQKGFFKDSGLDVEVKMFPSLTDVSKAYREQNIEARGSPSFDVLKDANNGLDQKIVLVVDYSNGGDGIIASKSIKSIKDAKGKRVAFEKGTLEEFFFIHTLEHYSLGIKDIVPIDLGPKEAAQAIVDGTADIAVTFEPFMSEALALTGGNKIYSSADDPGFISDVLVFHPEFIKKYPETVQAIIEAYFKALQFTKDNPTEAEALLAKRLSISPAEVTSALMGITILSKDENRVAVTFSAGLESLYGNMRSVDNFLAENLSIADINLRIDPDSLIDPSFIRSIKR
jgi:NitT/TauT family transport system substrate-binding protein